MADAQPRLIPQFAFEFAVGRIAPLVEETLRQRANVAPFNHAAAPRPVPVLHARTDTDLAALAYLQGMADIAQLLQQQGVLTDAAVEALT